MDPIGTVGAPGTQGAGVAGMQGIGVSTPRAAAVAAATAGLAGLVHMPNGVTFTNGTLSRMVAAGIPPAVTRRTGGTCSALGASPMLHRSAAPCTAWMGIRRSFPQTCQRLC